MRVLPSLISFSLVALTGLFVLPSLTFAGNIYLSPGSKSVAPGGTFSLGVRASMGGDLVNAAEANLSYPTDKLDFVGISAGGSAFPIDAASGGGGGGVRLSRGVIGQGVSGDKLIGTVTFRAKAAGTAAIGVSGSLVRGADQANVSSGGAGATITISGSAATSSQPVSNTSKPVVKISSPTQTPLQFTNITVTDVGFNKATITFITDRAISSLVEYGLSTQYGLTSQETKASTTHVIPLTSALLTPGTRYHFRVKSVDPALEGVSQDLTFMTKGLNIEITLTNSDNSPVAGQKVQLVTPNETKTGTTNDKGVVVFTDLSATQHTLIAEVLGEKVVQTISLTAPSEKDIASGALTSQKVQVRVAGAQSTRSFPYGWIVIVILTILPILLLVGLYMWMKRRKSSSPTIISQQVPTITQNNQPL